MTEFREKGCHLLENAQAALSRNCGVIVLDTLVGNDDRNNTRNAVFGFDVSSPTESAFMFLDHANSLNMHNRWTEARWGQVALPPMPELLRQSADWRVLGDVVDAVETLSDKTIEEIVGRMPDDYMAPQTRPLSSRDSKHVGTLSAQW